MGIVDVTLCCFGGGGMKLPFPFCRGGKPVSGRKNGGVSTKDKEKKQSGTESEQEVGINPVADLGNDPVSLTRIRMAAK